MTHVVKTYDLDMYADAKGQLVSEKVVLIEMDSLFRNHIWDLVPRSQRKNVVNSNWLIRPNIPLKVLLRVIRIVL